MPRKRRVGILRTPRDFRGINGAERRAWYWSGPHIYGQVRDVDGRFSPAGTPEPQGSVTYATVWPTWGEWFDVYDACREAFLAEHEARLAEGRRLQPPQAELFYWAMRAGLDPNQVDVPPMSQDGDDPYAAIAQRADRLDGQIARYRGVATR